MRKNYTIAMLLALFAGGMVSAQDVLVVEPGSGTLNAAIAQNGGDKIYQLKAGEWYGLDAVIENVDYHLQIIGEDYDDSTLPATLQTGTTVEGAPFANMISAKGDLTLKNIYIMNADVNGVTAARCIIQADSASTTVIDNCVVDPLGHFSVVEMNCADANLYVTNNIFARHGHMVGANDGHAFIINNASRTAGNDTILIQNNTFIDMGMNTLSGNFAAHVTEFLMIDHNTFIRSKSQMDWSILEDEYYLTNNLFFDFMTSPYAYNWQPMPGGDASMPKPMLIYADTIPDEVLPSQRIQYIQYNTMYRNQGFYDLIAEMNDSAEVYDRVKVNLHPLIWDGNTDPKLGADPAEAFAASREGHLFNHANNTNTDFPMWKYGNVSYDVDPGWNQQLIYDNSAKLVEWQRPASFIHSQGQSAGNYPPPTEWAQWHWDPDGDVAINDTWPLIDGTYTNAELLTGSVANLPLGDLNWFPEKKAMWEMYKDEIFAHMKAGNTEKWGNIGVGPVVEAGSFSKVYPNPMSHTSMLEFTLDTPAQVKVSIYNSLGQEVRNVLNEMRSSGTHTITIDRGDLKHGLYFYSIKAGNKAETQKLLILE